MDNYKLPFIINYCGHIRKMNSPYRHHLKLGLSCNAPHIQYITMHAKARACNDLYMKSVNKCCWYTEFRKAIWEAPSSMIDKCSKVPAVEVVDSDC